jgi:MFS family permease
VTRSVREHSAAEATPVARRPWLVLVVTCGAQFMGVLDVTIVNVALPSMRESLDLSAGGLQWVVNGYALTFASPAASPRPAGSWSPPARCRVSVGRSSPPRRSAW